MDRVVFAIAATATFPDRPVEQPLYTPIRSKDMAVFVLATTATHRDGHFQQHL